MPATTRRRTDLTTMRPKSRASLAPATVLNPNKRVLTPRPKPASEQAAPQPSGTARPRRQSPPSTADQAWSLAQRLAHLAWENRREPNLWLSLVVSAEIAVLLSLLITYRVLTP